MDLNDDLELARACARGEPAALSSIDALIAAETRRAVAPLAGGSADEIAQLVRERLLVGAAPRIAEYRGDGPLRAWLRAVAVRVALNARRGKQLEAPEAELPDLPLAAPDPELALFRAQYRDHFRTAFKLAVDGLSVRDRAVLRLHAIDGVKLAAIGVMYGKDTSTVSRWLEQARQALGLATRAELEKRLSVGPGELDSLMRAAERDVSVSLARLLA